MNVQRELEYVYGWNHYTMEFMGIWPNARKWNQVSSYKVFAPVIMMLCFVCAPQTVQLVYIWDDFDSVVENLSCGNITITISLLKTIAFWLHRKSLNSLLEQMAEDWENIIKTEERRTMLEIGKLIRNNCIRSTLMCHSVVVAYVLLRFMMIRQNGRVLLFRAYFPYNMHESPSYELTFVAQLIAALYAATTYTAVDTFVGMLVLHVCGQLMILREQLKNLCVQTHAGLRTRLGGIVRKHERLSKFAGTIEECVNMMLLVQMLGCTLQLCVQCLQAIMSINGKASETSIFQFGFLLLYVFYVMVQLYLYCYIGERLLVESTAISSAAYDCEWYNLSVNEAKLLIIIMMRAESPLRISAGRFCSFSLQLYSEILKRSMSYLSVLYAMRDKIQ